MVSRAPNLLLNNQDMVLFNLLGNNFLMGCDESGMLVKAHKDNTGYHRMGGVEGSPTSSLRVVLKQAADLLVAAKDAGRILLMSPIPPPPHHRKMLRRPGPHHQLRGYGI